MTYQSQIRSHSIAHSKPTRTPVESKTKMKSELLCFASTMVMAITPPTTVASNDANENRRQSSEVAKRSGIAIVAVGARIGIGNRRPRVGTRRVRGQACPLP